MVELADVHATIAWFLRHRSEAEACLAAARDEAVAQQAASDARGGTAGLRARLSELRQDASRRG